jgi:hypothetical protein
MTLLIRDTELRTANTWSITIISIVWSSQRQTSLPERQTNAINMFEIVISARIHVGWLLSACDGIITADKEFRNMSNSGSLPEATALSSIAESRRAITNTLDYHKQTKKEANFRLAFSDTSVWRSSPHVTQSRGWGFTGDVCNCHPREWKWLNYETWDLVSQGKLYRLDASAYRHDTAPK